jgi:hypothetical protein
LVLNDGTDTEAADDAEAARAEAGDPYRVRSFEQIAGFFDGLELLEPGVVSTSRWRAGDGPWEMPEEVAAFCGVAVKTRDG